MSLYVDIKKSFSDFELSVKLEAEDEIVALLGASGCGKSITLKCIAGIVKPDFGKIVINDDVVFDSEKRINKPPQQRKVGFSFQNYALFPIMTVWHNIASVINMPKKDKEILVAETIRALHLEETRNLYPSQLSGGQQQRVALARIIVSKPKIVMLDEPFSALDTHLRASMERELMSHLEGFQGTTLLVSHDRDEAYRISDKMAIMDQGSVGIVGSKEEIFADPKTVAAASITGCKNISKAEKLGDERIRALDWGIEVHLEKLHTLKVDFVGIRANHIEILAEKKDFEEGYNYYQAIVVKVVEEPFKRIVYLRMAPDAEKTLTAEVDKTLQISAGQEVKIRILKRRMICLLQ
ncbi:MAG: ATP-binding cassette domain-containing protein [Lachnospiraceae bacterium]|nr:ATP-binding cassette domain-containing protein [Lachnospiraceae bacterium]